MSAAREDGIIIASPTERFEQHPLSALLPSMPDVDFKALAADIKVHGQIEPGVVFEGMVLDGWHRCRACERAGVGFSYRNYGGEDSLSFVTSKNLHRRHMTSSQRGAFVVAATEWRANGVRSSSATVAELTTQQMAKLADVSTRTIGYAKTAHQKGLGEEVRSGRMSAKCAADGKAKKPAAAKEPKPVEEKTVPVSTYQALQAEHLKLQERYETLDATFEEMAQRLATFQSISNGQVAEDMNTLRQQLAQARREREDAMREAAGMVGKVQALKRELKELRSTGFKK